MKKNYETGLAASGSISWKNFLTQEKLLRLHPNWFVTGYVKDGENFRADIKDYATDEIFEVKGKLVFAENGLPSIFFEKGPVNRIAFYEKKGLVHVEVAFQGESSGEDDLLRWLTGIREYARIHYSTTLNTLFFRFVMNSMMLKMNPSQRKICMMLIKITLVEILVFVVIVAGYLIFMN